VLAVDEHRVVLDRAGVERNGGDLRDAVIPAARSNVAACPAQTKVSPWTVPSCSGYYC
jgi:hypothetical protein